MTSLSPQEDATGHNGGAPVIQVPHINIAAFCTDPGSASLMQAAAADRRMSRASLTIATGGAAAAAEAFREMPTPPVLIVECPGAPGDMLAELALLAEVCQPETRVIVIGRVNDIALYRELMDQGVSEYLIVPLTPIRLIEAIAALYRSPKAPPLGKTVAFIGARGGAGSSTLAHNLAWSLARQHGTNTVIADLDLAFGTAGLNFNEDIATGILDALSQPDRVDGVLLDRLLVSAGERLNLLAGSGGIDRDYEVDPQSVDTVLSSLRQSVPFTVADLPKQWSPWVKAALLHADHVVITAVPDLASLRNARGLAEFLRGARPNDPPPHLVMNQTGMPKRQEIKPDDFAKAAGLTVAAIIPHEPQTFGAALNRGKMIFEVAPKSKAAEALSKFSHQVAGAAKDTKKPADKGKSLFSFLRKA